MVCKKCKSEKYQKQIQHPVTDLKIELLVKIVNKFKLYTIFATGSEFSSDCNKSNVSYEQQKSYIMVFLERWLLLPSQDFTFSNSTIETLKTPVEDVKCVWS